MQCGEGGVHGKAGGGACVAKGDMCGKGGACMAKGGGSMRGRRDGHCSGQYAEMHSC